MGGSYTECITDDLGFYWNSGQSITVNELASMLNEILELKLEPAYQPARQGDVRDSQADVTRASQLIDFDAKISVREGLCRTVEWFQRKT